MATNETVPQPLKNQRSQDFASVYANNVSFEPSIWDLKLVFGELDQSSGVIAQHTSMTIPWSMAKLLMYHLRLNLLSHEIVYGKIAIAQDVIPTEIQPPPEQFKDNLLFQKVFEVAKKEREEFLKTI